MLKNDILHKNVIKRENNFPKCMENYFPYILKYYAFLRLNSFFLIMSMKKTLKRLLNSLK